MGLVRNNPETFENAVASLVDVTSILFAYQIGVYGFGMAFGVLYACFDAFLVIWMRKPITRFARAINPFRFVGRHPGERKEDVSDPSEATADAQLPGRSPTLTDLSPDQNDVTHATS